MLSDNDLQNADVITNYKNINRIDLSNNNISDLTDFDKWMEMLAQNRNAKPKLTELNISGNHITDLTPIGQITTLTILNVGSNNISDIQPITSLKGLENLDVSHNKIENISVLKELTNLKTLNLASNKIKDTSSLANLSLYNINISNNRIESLDDIEGMDSLNILKAGTNKITTIEPIKNKVLNKDELDLTYQKLHYALQDTDKGTITVELPKIFEESKEGNGLIYSSQDFECINCSLTDDGKVQINLDELGNKIATVKIKDGKAIGTQLAIAQPLKPVLTYSNEQKTKEDVTVTISFEGRQASIINNDGNKTHTFTKNGDFTFEYEDEYGFSGTITAKVNWIDKDAPKASVSYNLVEGEENKILVTITANEACKAIDGWNQSVDKMIFTKEYSINETDKVILEDEVGNQTELSIEFNGIDNEAPKIEGVKDGETYTTAVTPIITDDNLDRVELKKGETIVEGYKSGTPITENGEYTLTATDRFNHVTTVTFIINIPEGTKILTKLEIINNPNKMKYTEGEKFDKTGLVLKATYNDDEKDTKEITADKCTVENERTRVNS